ncbi:TraB/GumN family protein [Paracoccus sp. SCSIO 75233]|uniref:TraB/GumN family protein n=1 Tax=Paracoccus sp. SCSIO 75233 TaxID=3017782 RepID=UPI0022F0CFC4|nr:TraB/GumN family protein [Paracoccus sp. SCSIO 75233]WBU54326.1 TraB/GumN family protein [Paracoccus sp. SCSIO 75233]
MKHALAAVLLCLSGAAAAAQDCVGRNLIDALPAADRAEIAARTDAVPYHEGLIWQAAKGDALVTMVGTYHFDHPKHAKTIATLSPLIAEAGALLVEMGPQEQAQMQSAMNTDPSLMLDLDGPTLPERLTEEQWQDLSAAMEERGIPAVMIAKMRPWYAATMLGLAPCMIRGMAASGEMTGLDWQLMDVATGEGTKIRALEPWDTVLKLFDGLSAEEQIDMILYSLPAADYADDYAVTLADAYADEDVWKIWEFGRLDAYLNSGLSRAEVDRLTDEAQAILMDNRNESWIGPLTDAAEAAATEGKAVVAAFGALHLPGENGVLSLLEQQGWTISRLRQ